MSTQSVARIEGSGTVPHEEPIPARLRQLRVIIKELEQDHVQVVVLRPELQHVDTIETKAQIWAERTTERAIHRTKPKICKCKKVSRERFFHYGFN